MILTPAFAAADPAAPEYRFSIGPKAYAEALVDFAVQADISIGDTSVCIGASAGLDGRFTLEQGLKRLLAGAPCRFDMVDPHTVRLTPGPVRSATAPPQYIESDGIPEEIVITATKRTALADRLSAAVSVISASQLDQTNAVNVADTVDQIAAMSMTNLGPGRDKILLRGLSDGTFTGRTQSTVGTYLDDLPINYNAPDPDLRLADVEAVEVVRGPQGALYGGGSLSGIYRIVTRKPDFAAYSADLTVTNSWTASAAESRSVEGMVNVPLAADIAALRLVAYGDRDGGYLSNSDLQQSNVDRTKRIGGRATVETRIGDNWTVTAAATLQTLNSADAQYTVAGAAPRTRSNRVSEGDGTRFAQGSLTIARTGDWGRLVSSTGYVHHGSTSQYDASAALSLFDDSDTKDLGIYDETSRIDMLVEDFVLTSTATGRFQWLAGVYGSATMERTLSNLASSGISGPPQLRYEEDRHDHLDEIAPYGEASYSLAPDWTVTAGARIFGTDLRTESNTTVPSGQPRTFSRTDTFLGWAPKLSLQHDFASGDLVYGLVSEGYRSGGFNTGGINPPAASRIAFSPDHLTNFEIGAKLKLADRKIELRSALFYDRWTNIQTDQYLASGLSYTANVGNARTIGWEVEATYRPMHNLVLQVNALFNGSSVTKVNPIFAANVTSGLPGVPPFSFGGLAVYDVPLYDDLLLLFTTEIGYVGRSRLTFNTALSPSMGGYFDGKLSAQLKTPDWRLAAILSNPADVSGDSFSFGNPFSFGQVRQVTPLRPRTFSLVLSKAF